MPYAYIRAGETVTVLSGIYAVYENGIAQAPGFTRYTKETNNPSDCQ
jgi:hypothetical protein